MEDVLGFGPDNVPEGYDDFPNLVSNMLNISSLDASDITDWGEHDEHEDHSVDGVECADTCICGSFQISGLHNTNEFKVYIKGSEEFPVSLDDGTDEWYLKRLQYNEDNNITLSMEVFDADDDWNPITLN